MNPDSPIKPCGWITPLIGRIARSAQLLDSPFVDPRPHAQGRGIDDGDYHRNRAARIDSLLALSMLFSVGTFVFVTTCRTHMPAMCMIPTVLVGIRVCNMLGTILCLSIFDRLGNPGGKKSYVASRERVVILGFLNYLELVLCFAVFYAWHPEWLGNEVVNFWDPLYFSATTQLALSNANASPEGWFRLIATIQGFSAMLILVVLISRFVALMPSIDSVDDSDRH